MKEGKGKAFGKTIFFKVLGYASAYYKKPFLEDFLCIIETKWRIGHLQTFAKMYLKPSKT